MYYEVFLSPATEIVVLGQLSGYLILKRGDTGNYWYYELFMLIRVGGNIKHICSLGEALTPYIL